MDRFDVIDLLKKGVVVVEFKKVNGEYRKMQCTLYESFLPEQIDIEEDIQKKKPYPDVMVVYDIEAKGWRSFRWENLKTVNGVIWSV